MSDASRHARLVVVLVALGCALRLTGLGTHSLWIDEAGTLYVAHAGDLVEALRGDRHPPLSFLLFRGWIALFGEGDVALRLLPALASCASLALLALLARTMLEPRAQLCALALAAVSPVEIWMAQEVRMYAFVELCALGALVAAQAWIARPRAWLIVAAGIACALATGLHYFGAFTAVSVAALAGLAVARKKCLPKHALALSACALAGALAWTPWIASVLRDQLAVGAGFQAKIGVRALLEMPVRLVLVGSENVPERWMWLVYATGCVLGLGVLSCALRAVRAKHAGALDALVILAVPPACALAASLFGPLNFIARYFAAAIPGAELAIACGFDGVRARAPRIALVSLALIGCLALTIVLKSGNAREDWRSACEEVARAWKPGDRILALTHLEQHYSDAPLRHYFRDRQELIEALVDAPPALAAGTRLHVVYRDTRYAKPAFDALRARFHVVEQGPMRHDIIRLVLD